MQAQFYFLNVNGSSRVKPPPLTFTLEILADIELPIEVIIKCLAVATISIPTAMLIPVLFHIHCLCWRMHQHQAAISSSSEFTIHSCVVEHVIL